MIMTSPASSFIPLMDVTSRHTGEAPIHRLRVSEHGIHNLPAIHHVDSGKFENDLTPELTDRTQIFRPNERFIHDFVAASIHENTSLTVSSMKSPGLFR